MGDSVGVASSPIFPCNNSVISSFSRSLGGTLFMALISSGSARNGASCVSSLGGYQRLFAFTGTLALHRDPLLALLIASRDVSQELSRLPLGAPFDLCRPADEVLVRR